MPAHAHAPATATPQPGPSASPPARPPAELPAAPPAGHLPVLAVAADGTPVWSQPVTAPLAGLLAWSEDWEDCDACSWANRPVTRSVLGDRWGSLCPFHTGRMAAERELPDLAGTILGALREHFPAPVEQQRDRQVLALAEEVGEFVGAYRRWSGAARRAGSWAEVADELADVLITAWVVAAALDLDLDDAWRAKAERVLARGWKDPR